VARHIATDVEDRLQDAVAQTYEMYRRYILARGKVLDDGILVHSCRQRATDLGRRFVKDDGQPRRDALHPANYRDGRVVEVLRLDGLVDDDGDFPPEHANGVVIGLAEKLAADPSRKMISASDLERWLASLSVEDQAILALRYTGCTLGEVAALVGCSLSKVFSRLRQLGFALADRAGVNGIETGINPGV